MSVPCRRRRDRRAGRTRMADEPATGGNREHQPACSGAPRPMSTHTCCHCHGRVRGMGPAGATLLPHGLCTVRQYGTVRYVSLAREASTLFCAVRMMLCCTISVLHDPFLKVPLAAPESSSERRVARKKSANAAESACRSKLTQPWAICIAKVLFLIPHLKKIS